MPEVALDQRLDGCTAGSLDSYLRGLGVIRLAARHVPEARFWWSPDATLCVEPPGVEELIESLADAATPCDLGGGVRSAWRGSKATGTFDELRNAADESLLAWFDACGVVRYDAGEPKRVNNPLLGQGGGFGRSELEPALDLAVAKLDGLAEHPGVARRTLAATVRGQPLDRRDVRLVSVSKKVLGAYQSGRASGPGGSRRDVDPSGQAAPASAWDLVLTLEGLRGFGGSATRQVGGRRGVQASFPLLVRARAIGPATQQIGDARGDEGERWELLAPLWSAAARPAVVLHLIHAFRLRVNGRPASDTVDALVSHATARGEQVGFDRLVRFSFAAPSDPRYQYAIRRGTSTAQGSRSGLVITEDLLPFLRRAGGWSPRERVSGNVRRARQIVDAQTVRTAAEDHPAGVVSLLAALVEFETALARSGADLETARLGGRWWGLGRGRDLRLGAGLAWAATVLEGEGPQQRAVSIGRRALLAQNSREGRSQLDPDRGETGLARSGRATHRLAHALIAELRRAESATLELGPQAPGFADLVDLLDGSISDADLIQATLAAARIDIAPRPRPTRYDAPGAARHSIGEAVASLLLAPYGHLEDVRHEIPARDQPAILARKTRLAALALADNPVSLARAADRMLAPAGLRRRPAGDRSLAAIRSVRLALALMLPLDSNQRGLLAAPLRKNVESRSEEDE